ncbi:hypothetical protein DQ392_27390 [Streptomyces reniochalinae]|uniref:Uncharacterized protein n=1 Tax=Streptomyces reniochalinae TaxID=2250578 RepID=A0A367EBW0_9ACTN|nr:hypothetical protein DQ392_27390 [Streptomyces reniochalinae]
MPSLPADQRERSGYAERMIWLKWIGLAVAWGIFAAVVSRLWYDSWQDSISMAVTMGVVLLVIRWVEQRISQSGK